MHSKTDNVIALRPAEPEDRGFLFARYASTRSEELALLPWSEAEKNAFLNSQFLAQQEFYTQNYPGAQFQVILLNHQPAA